MFNLRELVSANERQSELLARVRVGSLWVIIRVLQVGGEGRLRQNEWPWEEYVAQGQNRMILPVGRGMMDPPFLLKSWLPAWCPFCEKCSFFPLCYGQYSMIFCALMAFSPT